MLMCAPTCDVESNVLQSDSFDTTNTLIRAHKHTQTNICAQNETIEEKEQESESENARVLNILRLLRNFMYTTKTRLFSGYTIRSIP